MEELNIRIGGVEATPVGNIQKRFSGMIWGAPGVGKTMLAATAPGKKLWILKKCLQKVVVPVVWTIVAI